MCYSDRIVGFWDSSNYQNANFINSSSDILFEEENAKSLLKDPNSFMKYA